MSSAVTGRQGRVDPERWQEFRRRYREELRQHADQLEELQGSARQGPLMLVYAARDEERDNALALREILQKL